MVERWLASGEHEVPEDPSWMTAREAARAAGMRFTKRRSEYLLRRWVGKRAVALTTGTPTDVSSLARIEVANHASGAPFVLVDGSPAGLEVSLTDRAGWAVALVGDDLRGVGCDLEIVEPRSTGFVTDFLTPAEQNYLDGLTTDDDRHEAANLLWSAKESALKVLKTGLRRDTRSVEVTVVPPGAEGAPPPWGRLRITTAEGLGFSGWWMRAGEFVFTVAASSPSRPPEALPGSARLVQAVPVHSWVDRPLAVDQAEEPH